MKSTYTMKELKNLDVIKLNALCEKYDLPTRCFRTFSYSEKIAFVYSQQIRNDK